MQRAICQRLRSLGMDVLAQGFAGAVPAGLKRVHPQAKMAQLTWCGRYHSWFLYPDDPLFVRIGTEIVSEWEKEFGRGEYYLQPAHNPRCKRLRHEDKGRIPDVRQQQHVHQVYAC